jgi:chitinase
MKKVTLVALLLHLLWCSLHIVDALPHKLSQKNVREFHWQLGDEGGIWSSNCDFPDNDDDPSPLTGFTENVQCGQQCMDTIACTHYTWSNIDGGTCQLRQGDVTRESAVPSSKLGATCGIMPYKRPHIHVTKVMDIETRRKLLPTFAEFVEALTVNDYAEPNQEQYQNFVQGATSVSDISTKTELAMFLTHIIQESGGLKFKIEKRCGKHCTATGVCLKDYKTPQDASGQHYCGRGYIQLSWAYNYKACSEYIFGDDRLVSEPDQVATNDKIAWASAFWYWKENVRTNEDVLQFKFGASTNQINGDLECRGVATDVAKERYNKYVRVLKAFNIDDEPIEDGCYN